MNKSLSIITINYNNKSGLERTLKSVFEQTFTNFEFIIIDGNSTDGSKELLESNITNFTHCIIEPDLGIYNAMNKGIRLAKGDFLLFLNSGDSLINLEILENVEHLINDEHDIFYGNIFHTGNGDLKEETFPDTLPFSFFYTHNLAHQASFIKRKLFYEIFFYNEQFSIASDWEFFVYAICKMNVSYKHLNMFISNYDTSGISSITENHNIVRSERLASLKKYFPAFVDEYFYVSQLSQNRVKQFFEIKKHPISWRILKICMSIINFFKSKPLVNF